MLACGSNVSRKPKYYHQIFCPSPSSRKEHWLQVRDETQHILISSTLKTGELPSLRPSQATLPCFQFTCSLLVRKGRMQGVGRAARSCQEMLKLAVLQHQRGRSMAKRKTVLSGIECVTTSNPAMEQKGLDNTTVAEALMTKGDERSGSWLWCRTNDTVYDAAKHMAENNIGSLVVLKPGEPKYIAGIFTERDYMRKIIAGGRCPRNTIVGEIMTYEKKLVTVSSDTKILQAMQLLTEHQIRHVPVIDGKIVGMISIVDIVRAVVEQQSLEVKRLNEFIKGDYY